MQTGKTKENLILLGRQSSTIGCNCNTYSLEYNSHEHKKIFLDNFWIEISIIYEWKKYYQLTTLNK